MCFQGMFVSGRFSLDNGDRASYNDTTENDRLPAGQTAGTEQGRKRSGDCLFIKWMR